MEMKKKGRWYWTKNRTNAGSHCARARYMRPKPLALLGRQKTMPDTDEKKQMR
jgi:hypothetical protein